MPPSIPLAILARPATRISRFRSTSCARGRADRRRVHQDRDRRYRRDHERLRQMRGDRRPVDVARCERAGRCSSGIGNACIGTCGSSKPMSRASSIGACPWHAAARRTATMPKASVSGSTADVLPGAWQDGRERADDQRRHPREPVQVRDERQRLPARRAAGHHAKSARRGADSPVPARKPPTTGYGRNCSERLRFDDPIA